MRALVCGAGGFLGAHMVTRLRADGAWVRGVDQRVPEFSPVDADDFVVGDLRDAGVCRQAIDGPFDEVFQFAAEMGGAGFVFTGANDAAILSHSVLINVNVLDACARARVSRVFFPSSACVYPASVQADPRDPRTSETLAYPAEPDSEYGWEKLFAERMYAAYARAGLDVRLARLHSVFGPRCTWRGGREKSVAAICRKVAETPDGGDIEIWGDGEQTRTFLYVDEALDGFLRLMRSDFQGPVNIGSEELISIRGLVETVADIARKRVHIRTVPGPTGVRGRSSDNTLLRSRLGWAPSRPLRDGLTTTYHWVAEQVRAAALAPPA